MNTIKHPLYSLEFLTGKPGSLWSYWIPGAANPITVAAPQFEIDGNLVTAELTSLELSSQAENLPNGCTEYRLSGVIKDHPELSLEILVRTAPDNPVVRFCYRLLSAVSYHLTKNIGHDRLEYTRLSLDRYDSTTEITLSEFNEMTHAYNLVEREIPHSFFQAGLQLPGPILTASGQNGSLLLAYEHGSNVPNTYVQFRLGENAPGERWIAMEALKGNYFHSQPLDLEHPFETIWFQLAVVPGGLDDLAQSYRTYILEHFSLYPASRQPLIFYNTWNYQERNRHWNGRPYLESMNETRILAEIDSAHRLGIEVFVIDTGWYSKTGDWQVDLNRFPNGLANIRAKLKEYGMQLGLWFNPTAAAISSRLHQEMRDCAASRDGVEPEPFPVWETEESRSFCLVSRYADAFADELIRLNRELGVTYFKWDAVGQEAGCDSPFHQHGDARVPPKERAECWEFELVRALSTIARRVCSACPQAIVDLDLTESGRSLGLAFLEIGKFFLINNGPYFGNYDVPTPGTNENLFFYPGAARPAICRSALTYDRWIPSVLFLTHFFPDDTPDAPPHWSQPNGKPDSQEVNLATLILGGNGIWGDLLSISETGVHKIHLILQHYKRLRKSITRASPVRQGQVGSSPEIHEKLSRGQGVVVIFSPRRGEFTTITKNLAGSVSWCSEDIRVDISDSGQAIIQAIFQRPGAKIIFFE